MAREKKRRGEKPQWRATLRTWMARVWETDGSCSGWRSLGTDDRELATKAYERWLETGLAPAPERGQETFEAAAERLTIEHEADGAITVSLAHDRRQRLRRFAYPEIGHLEVATLEPHHIASTLKAMARREQKSAGTVLKLRSDISQILVALLTEGALRDNVARDIAVPKAARRDDRERVSLTDEQLCTFVHVRGYGQPLDLMVLLCRSVGGHRTGDLHAADWSDLDLGTFETIRVRRPKTDRLRKRRDVHEIHSSLRAPLRSYWERQGSPVEGPLFPRLREPVRVGPGRAPGNVGGARSTPKAKGSSYAKALRRAVWKAGIHDPLPGWNPDAPDPAFCRLQTDTPETRRLDFHSLRRGLVTALADAGTNVATSLALTGHTQLSTQLKHYMNGRTVGVPEAALPGRGQPPPQPLPQPPKPVQPQTHSVQPRTSLPGLGRIEGARGLGGHRKSSESLVSPSRFEREAVALGMQLRAKNSHESRINTPVDPPPGSPSEGVSSQSVGENQDALTLLRSAAAAAVMAGDWKLVDRIRAVLAPSEPAVDHSNVRRLDALRGKHR